jgi:peptide/nickel transport system substrate-binding protein
MERLDFGTDPVDERPRILASADVRRAIAACIDRQGLIDQLAFSLSPLPAGMIAAGHPLAASESSVAYSPATANETLASLGWIDDDDSPTTPRVAQRVDRISPGTALALTLLAASDSTDEIVAQTIAEDLAQCGVGVEVETVPAEALYTPWPDGPVFGRSFDLVVWPWLEWISPACELFTTAEIASAAFPQGSNASGFEDPAYDNACGRARLGTGDPRANAEAYQEAQQILDGSLPAVPLFQWPRLLVASETVCGLQLDPTAALLWNLEELKPGPACGP